MAIIAPEMVNVWLHVKAFVESNGNFIQAVSAAVQAVSAIAIVALTWPLVIATKKSNQTAQDALAVARQDLENTWRPTVVPGISIRNGTIPDLIVLNLSQFGILVSAVAIKARDRSEIFHISLPAPVGETARLEILSQLLKVVTPIIDQEANTQPGSKTWSGELTMFVAFKHLGKVHQSEPVTIKVYVDNGWFKHAEYVPS